MKSYFISCVIANEPNVFETTNLAGTLAKLFRWASSGFEISKVSIKPTHL